jgi:hypothetical protein
VSAPASKPKPVLLIVLTVISLLALCIAVPQIRAFKETQANERAVFERLESKVAVLLETAQRSLLAGKKPPREALRALGDAEACLPVLRHEILTEKQEDREKLAKRVSDLQDRLLVLRTAAAGSK